jgi:hypothetical protein
MIVNVSDREEAFHREEGDIVKGQDRDSEERETWERVDGAKRLCKDRGGGDFEMAADAPDGHRAVGHIFAGARIYREYCG